MSDAAAFARGSSAPRAGGAPPYPLAYSVLSHLQAPVTLYGFFLPIWLYGWWSILFVPLAAQLGNMLDRVHSVDGSPIGNAFTTSTIFTLTAGVHALLPLATGSLGGFGGWCLALVLSYVFVAQMGGAMPNFEFSAFCACLGVAAMALQAVDGLEGGRVAGGWWPLAFAAAGTLVSAALCLPGMPCHQSAEELEASAYGPNGGYGTAHHTELDAARRQHRGQRRRR